MVDTQSSEIHKWESTRKEKKITYYCAYSPCVTAGWLQRGPVLKSKLRPFVDEDWLTRLRSYSRITDHPPLEYKYNYPKTKPSSRFYEAGIDLLG